MRLFLLDSLLRNSADSKGEYIFLERSTTNVVDQYLESLVTSLFDELYPSHTLASMPKP